MLVLVFSLCALVATLAGGLLVLRLGKLPEALLAFSAGTLLAVVGFDLLPRTLAVFGFGSWFGVIVGYGALRLWHGWSHASHSHGLQDKSGVASPSLIGAGALIFHKLCDGAVFGLGDGAALSLGLGVALALHSFCDGINTVTLVMRARASRSLAILFLTAATVAPLAAALGVKALALPVGILDWLLTFVAGAFIYVSLHDLLLTVAANLRTDRALPLGMAFLGGFALTGGLVVLLGG